MYKRTNILLEREIKFQAVAAVSQKDSSKKREDNLYSKINILNDQKLLLNTELATEKDTKSKLWMALSVAIIALLLSILFSIFKSKLAKFIPFLSLISFATLAQDPMYRPPVSINGQKGVMQKIIIDSTANNYAIFSLNDIHTLRIP
ncbi:hypothetical protein, partial [Emticicia sp.]|uniref:hypothetical protein n=1 Tax=Emticicia sp. TaxID=1930953 RepID=UPI0037522AA8